MPTSATVVLEFTEIRKIKKHTKDVCLGHSIFINIATFIMTLLETDFD